MSVCLPIVEKAKKGRLRRRKDCGTRVHGILASLLKRAPLVWLALLLGPSSLCLSVCFCLSVMSPHKAEVRVWKRGSCTSQALLRHKNLRSLSEHDPILWGWHGHKIKISSSLTWKGEWKVWMLAIIHCYGRRHWLVGVVWSCGSPSWQKWHAWSKAGHLPLGRLSLCAQLCLPACLTLV